MNTCQSCKAYKQQDGYDCGSCRLHPPVFSGDSAYQYPIVESFDWCLDWQSKEKKAPVKRDVTERGITVAEYVYACEVKGVSPVSDNHRAFAKTLGIDVGPEWGKFKNYCLAHGKRYINFEAAFRNWLANSTNMKLGGK